MFVIFELWLFLKKLHLISVRCDKFAFCKKPDCPLAPLAKRNWLLHHKLFIWTMNGPWRAQLDVDLFVTLTTIPKNTLQNMQKYTKRPVPALIFAPWKRWNFSFILQPRFYFSTHAQRTPETTLLAVSPVGQWICSLSPTNVILTVTTWEQ